MGDELKSCPFCKEQIRKEAVKCRFCGEWLDQSKEVEKIAEDEKSASTIVKPSEIPPPISAKIEEAAVRPEESPPTNLPKILNVASICLLVTSCVLMASVLKDVNVSSERVAVFTEKLTEAIGRMLIASGVFAWVCRSGAGKRKGVGLFAFSIALLVCSIIFVSNFKEGANRAKQRSKEESKQISESLMDIVGQATNGTISHIKPTGNAELDTALQPLLRLMQQFSKSLEQMEQEIASLQQEDVFSVSMLTNKSNIQSEITRSIAAQKIFEKYHSQFPAMVDAARKKYDGLNVSEDIKRGSIKGFDESLSKQRPQVEEMFNLRERREAANLQFLQFMLGAFDDYQMKDSGISFKSDTNLSKYKLFVKNIQDSIREAEEFQKRQFQTVEETKAKIQKIAE